VVVVAVVVMVVVERWQSNRGEVRRREEGGVK